MSITQSLLTQIEPIIKEILEKEEIKYFEENQRLWSPFHAECERLQLTYNMLKSMITYTKPTDTLGDFSIRRYQGQLTIEASIIREENKFYLFTEIIFAGGYNIQRLHIRYITKTNLKNEKDLTPIKYIQEKIKTLSKIEKIQQEINQYEKRIKLIESKIEDRNKMSNDEILQTSLSYQWLIITHDEINRDSHNWKIYGNDPIGWEQYQEQQRNGYIEGFKKSTLIMQNRDIPSFEKSIKKLQIKADKLSA